MKTIYPAKDYDVAASDAKLCGKPPPDRCEWLKANAKNYTPAQVKATEKAWGMPPFKSWEISMAYIPNDAEWYLADLILEIRVEDDPRSLVHINTLLVNASSPNEAYDKALQLGEQQIQQSN